jgi:DNA-binding transcriptional LysR family regulator
VDSRQLVAFKVVAQTGNMTRAATKLGYSQSAISAQIKSLESLVRASLFERRRDGMRLTTSGRRFMPYATRILKLAEEARSALTHSSDLAGALTIGAGEAITTYLLPDVVESFRHSNPEVRISLRTIHEGPGNILSALADGHIDLALVNSAHRITAAFEKKEIVADDVLLVAASHHPLANCGAVTAGTLRDARILTSHRDCVYASLLPADSDGLAPPEQLELGTIEGVKKAIAAGLGVAVLPRAAVADLIDSGAVTALPWQPAVPVTTYAVWHDGRCEPPLLEAFLATLDRVVSE